MVLAFLAMESEDNLTPDQELFIEEADAWFEYLEVTRSQIATGRYSEVEPWVWARLTQRLRAVERKRDRLRTVVA